MKPAFGPWNSQSSRILTGRAWAVVGTAAVAGGAAGAAAGAEPPAPATGPGAQAASRVRPKTPITSQRRYGPGSRADMVVLLHSPAPGPSGDQVRPAAPLAAWAVCAPRPHCSRPARQT